eukprot:COSAG01_NODE_11566_length_1902_cov_1.788131_2_plen_148_part_00
MPKALRARRANRRRRRRRQVMADVAQPGGDDGGVPRLAAGGRAALSPRGGGGGGHGVGSDGVVHRSCPTRTAGAAELVGAFLAWIRSPCLRHCVHGAPIGGWGGLVASSALCVAVVAQMFRLPWHEPLIAVMFSVRRHAVFAAATPA